MYNWEIRRKFRTQKSFRPVFFSFIPKKNLLVLANRYVSICCMSWGIIEMFIVGANS